MIKIINIKEEDSKQVQDLYYKYNASLDIISYLMSQNQNIIKQEYIQNYLNNSENNFMLLEELKNKISFKYLPEEFNNKNYNYSFNFNNNTIIYEVYN